MMLCITGLRYGIQATTWGPDAKRARLTSYFGNSPSKSTTASEASPESSSKKPELKEEPELKAEPLSGENENAATTPTEKSPAEKPKPKAEPKPKQGNDQQDELKLDGAVKVCEFPDPECHLLLLEDGSLALQSQCGTNRKLAKHSLLLWIGQGKLGKSSTPLENALAYHPEKLTTVLDFQTKQVTTLSHMVKANTAITEVLGCKSFPAGGMSGLTSDGTSWYLSGLSELHMKMEAALLKHNVKDVAWVWAFAPNGSKLLPQGIGQVSLQSLWGLFIVILSTHLAGIGLMTMKQLLLHAQKTVRL